MKRFINIATVFFICVILVLIIQQLTQSQQLKAEVTKLSDVEYILNNLKIRNAENCRVTPIEVGWRCVEHMPDCGNGVSGFCGKIFIVRRPM